MRKVVLIIALAMSLGGCVVGDILTASTASISNPVTKDMLYEVENGTIIAFAGLKAYKRSCANLLIEQKCRQTIRQIQVYTRKLPPLLATLRSFVKNNDQVNAVIAYNTINNLVADIRAIASANNIQVQ